MIATIPHDMDNSAQYKTTATKIRKKKGMELRKCCHTVHHDLKKDKKTVLTDNVMPAS
jgi:hypothetical protein